MTLSLILRTSPTPTSSTPMIRLSSSTCLGNSPTKMKAMIMWLRGCLIFAWNTNMHFCLVELFKRESEAQNWDLFQHWLLPSQWSLVNPLTTIMKEAANGFFTNEVTVEFKDKGRQGWFAFCFWEGLFSYWSYKSTGERSIKATRHSLDFHYVYCC